ncbi:MAG: aminoglycoside phosphotransferase family protein [Candidatus Lokiarchaeota archaeon]|nr:aminoglycoside phosphotransferase family protein [Candidatus Lokiarchaeota archaeon]
MAASQAFTVGKASLALKDLDALVAPAKKEAGIPASALPMHVKGPFDGKINSIYRLTYDAGAGCPVTFIFRARISEAFRYEAIVKEKILFPILDGTINLHAGTGLRSQVEQLLAARTGSHVFSANKPPAVPVQSLYHYDETCKRIPHLYSVMGFLPGISLYEYIDARGVKHKKLADIPAPVARVLQAAFTDVGEAMAKIHAIEFPAFYNSITDIGDDAKAVNWKQLFAARTEQLMDEATRWPAIKPYLVDFRRYFKDSMALIPEHDVPVLFHNDFQPQNFIVDEMSGKVAGFIDFDNWQVGVREQEFVKMQYWGLRDLDPAFEQAFLAGYRKHHAIGKDFLARVDVYKSSWFLLVYNFEMSKIAKNEANITVDKRFPAAEKYIEEIKRIVNG